MSSPLTTVKVGSRQVRVTVEGVFRGLLMAFGVFLGVVGLTFFYDTVSTNQWFRVGVWAGGGVLLNDAVLAPLALVTGFFLLRRVRDVRLRRTLRALTLLLMGVLFALIPLLATGGLR